MLSRTFGSIAWALGLAVTLPPASVLAADALRLYSERQPFLIQPLLDAFTEATGTEVSLVYAKEGMLERIKAEGPNSPADLVLTVDIGQLSDMVTAGVLAETSSTTLEDKIPAHLRDPQGRWYGLTQRARVLFVSRERVAADETFTYESLADPKYKGLLCMRSGKHPYNLSLIASMIAHHGEEKTRHWLDGVKANLARKPQGNDRAQAKAIFEGQCDIAVANTYYYGKMATSEDKPEQQQWAKAIRVVFPNQEGRGAHMNISGAGVLQSAEDKDAAIRLIEFLASPQAQEIYARQNFEYPVVAGVAADAVTTALGTFKADTIPLPEVAAQRALASRLVDQVDFDSGP